MNVPIEIVTDERLPFDFAESYSLIMVAGR